MLNRSGKLRIDARQRSINSAWQIFLCRNGLDFAALDCHAVEELPTATGPANYSLFSVNDIPHTSHADQLVKTCREDFNHDDDFVKEITGNRNVDRPPLRIREFRKRSNPKVVVTLDMLLTGNKSKFIVFDCFDRTHLAS